MLGLRLILLVKGGTIINIVAFQKGVSGSLTVLKPFLNNSKTTFHWRNLTEAVSSPEHM